MFMARMVRWRLRVIPVALWFQKSSSAAQKKAVPGSTPGQDWDPDKQPRAHGESRLLLYWDCTNDPNEGHSEEHITLWTCPTFFFFFK